MPFFDAPGEPFVAGSTLVPAPKTAGVDDSPNAIVPPVGSPPYDVRQVDLIVHAGKPTVAWVEVDAAGFVRGPYVSAFDGVSWNALGGEVGVLDGLTPTPNHTLSVQPFGTRYIPNWPTLASDGTSLYLLYSYRESAAAPGGGFWAPRHEVVKRWDGASWSDFGKIDPSTNNSKNSGSGAGYLFDPVLCASAAEPGVCYASFREQGFLVATPGPFSNWTRQTIIARFDGSSIAGSQQTLASISGSGSTSYTGTAGLDAVAGVALGNESGEAFIFRSDSGNARTANLQMIAWSGLAVVQSILTNGFAGFPIQTGYAVRGGVGRYYLLPGNLLQVAADGSGPFEPYLGSAVAETVPTPDSNALLQKALMPDGPTNMWMVVGRGVQLNHTEVWWFHANCPAWSIQGWPSATIPWEPLDVSYGAAVLLGDTIYFAYLAEFGEFGRLFVEEIPILRDALFCGGTSIHFFDHITVS